MTELAWRPSAPLAHLRKRADYVRRVRDFFAKRDIWEVETPLLSPATVTDPHIQSIPTLLQRQGMAHPQTAYLQTSPEYAMKRLLAAGSGPIYQITKSFRQGEWGRLHHPEFTMLEWYRPGFDHRALMAEMVDFLRETFDIPAVDFCSYRDVFMQFLTIDPHTAPLSVLMECARGQAWAHGRFEDEQEIDFWVGLLFSHCIEPQLGHDKPIIVYDFPSSQAALAKIRDDHPPVASRFELYFKGTEIANGFHELQDPVEQRQRFENDLLWRAQKKIADVPIDESFLAALEHGLPDCAGVAVGLDRLLLLAIGGDAISEVMSFTFDQSNHWSNFSCNSFAPVPFNAENT